MASNAIKDRPQLSDSGREKKNIRLKEILENASREARRDIEKTEDRSARALYEVTAEVLDGLTKAFRDFEKKEEPAWR